MNILRVKALLGAGCFSIALIGAAMHPAHAGGLERGGYDIDLLFDPAPVATEAEATYVMPDRKYKNALGPGGAPLGPGFSSTADGAEPYWVPRIGVKAQVVQGVDCMFDYSQPWGAHTAPGSNWNGAVSNIETDIKSDNYAATCSYKFDAGKGQLRFLGGVFYQKVYGFKEGLTNIGFGPMVGRVDLDSSGWGWRAGIAYEIPDIALRASLVYNSQVKLDNISGTLDIGGVVSTPIYAPTQSMPDTLEFKLQSGIAPGWLAFGSVKWVNWSVLQIVPICTDQSKALGAACNSGVTNPAVRPTSLDLMYRDGWTVSGGIGHKFNDEWSAAGQLTWDRGTSHGYGVQTDTWTLGGGVAYTPQPNVELRLAGAIGVMTSGHSGTLTDENGYTAGEDATYDVGNDLVTAISGGIKIKF
ncbi:OmpP1/FadL family transporter [Mesorhizobium sp. B2-8-9]|uniref:OmpP1/FadL family transporter n=1 Tax=Mesorhizobium sp. B2-8-9 TaxID=2589899 RepID=UPI00112A490D|nr:OmpP1/FadL family transporter [Mesorhizobium sp. B2-8-9]TPI83477.1 transporter [Mesorhizobium sp. B2-8-9]